MWNQKRQVLSNLTIGTYAKKRIQEKQTNPRLIRVFDQCQACLMFINSRMLGLVYYPGFFFVVLRVYDYALVYYNNFIL